VLRAPLQIGSPAVAALERVAHGTSTRADAKQLLYLRHLGLLRDGHGTLLIHSLR
jgi:hypothetical protein